jgi:iron only hydrogenase large subunit-like protein
METSKELIDLLKVLRTKRCVCLLAPSFVVDFKYPNIIKTLKKLGFAKVSELTYAAKLINSEYKKQLTNTKKPIICANCPSIVKTIETRHPEYKQNIADIGSPMTIMGRFIKTHFGKENICVFVGPCVTKKIEALEHKKDIDYAITFKELQQIIDYAKKNKLFIKLKGRQTKDFDKYYNDYTKIYPLGGAVAETMHAKNILTKNQTIIGEGPENVEKALQKINKNTKFVDLLFCHGGCVGGPGIISQKNIQKREAKVRRYRDACKKIKIGKNLGKIKYAQNLNLKRN